MPNVFITQLPTRYDKATSQRIPAIDANPAAQYGELKTLFGPDTPRSEAIQIVSRLNGEIGPDDMILAAGDVALLAVTIAMALRQNGRATILRWDNESKIYRKEEIWHE